MVILPGIRVIVRGFLCIVRGFLSDSPKKIYVHVLAQCAVQRNVILVEMKAGKWGKEAGE